LFLTAQEAMSNYNIEKVGFHYASPNTGALTCDAGYCPIYQERGQLFLA
jgi:hypothetical protein